MKRILASLLLLSAFATFSTNAKADVAYTVDQGASWQGFMNVFFSPLDGGGYVFGSGWGVPDLVSVFDNPANTLTLRPNSVNDPSTFWYLPSGGPGSTGNKIMDANTYVELPVDTVSGTNVTFSGVVLSNSLTSQHVAKAFIRDFSPSYGLDNSAEVVLAPGPFSINLNTIAGAGRHVQYGFNFYGPNVWITDVAPYGSVVIQTVAPAVTNGDFDDDGDVDGRDFLIWQRGGSPGGAGSVADLTLWQETYGTGTGGLAAVTAIPEPAGLSLIASLFSLLVIRRSR